jgi:hypothetical protein
MARKAATVVAVAAVGMILLPGAGAAASVADTVNGSGTFDQGLGPSNEPGVLSIIDARSGPSGENPTGQVDITLGISLARTTFHGEVTCLAVTGHTAVVSGPVPNPLNLDVHFVAAVEDNAGSGRTDRVGAVVSMAPAPPCPSPIPALVPLATGDFSVFDAPPPPSTYAQCRLAGWVKYGFESHAACIAYVHDLARRKCIFERVAHGVVAFRAKYGLGPGKDHAMRHCVRLYTGF